MQEYYSGVDVSKDKFDFSILINSKYVHKVFKNNKTGFSELRKFLLENKVNKLIIGLESTGSYHIDLSNFMYDNNHDVYVLNPKRVKDFIKSMGYNTKTDSIDSKAILDFIEFNHKKNTVNLYVKPSDDEAMLKAYLKIRSDLIQEKTRESNRMGSLHNQIKELKEFYKNKINYINKELLKIDKKIKILMSKNKTYSEKQEKLTEIKGVGFVTVMTVLSILPELGYLSKNQITSLVGLAPHPRESGNLSRKRFTKKGRSNVKSVLYMAAMSAQRHNKDLKIFYNRLVKNGKPKKVALVAVMRKLLVMMNAIMKTYIKENCEKGSI